MYQGFTIIWRIVSKLQCGLKSRKLDDKYTFFYLVKEYFFLTCFARKVEYSNISIIEYCCNLCNLEEVRFY